ncbi:MAG: hypothetical protein AAGE96_10940 [Cyanobacteria bacterium P01_G01_bin.19]
MTDSKQGNYDSFEINSSLSIFLERLQNKLQNPIQDSESIELLQEEVSISNEELAIAIE